MRVFSTRTYERAIRKLLGEEARREMEESIVASSGHSGHCGIRKLHGPVPGVGSGEAFARSGGDAVYLLTAYAKADREDLTPADTRALARLVATIKKGTTRQ